jgi:hypothetical protein
MQVDIYSLFDMTEQGPYVVTEIDARESRLCCKDMTSVHITHARHTCTSHVHVTRARHTCTAHMHVTHTACRYDIFADGGSSGEDVIEDLVSQGARSAPSSHACMHTCTLYTYIPRHEWETNNA